MSTTVEAASAMEARSAVGNAPAVEAASDAAAIAGAATCKPAARSKSTPTDETASHEAAAESGAAPITEWPSVSVKPGTGADEHATREPLRSVIPVRCAGVRGIIVIAPAADRCRTHITVCRPPTNTHPNLRVGIHAGKHKHRQQSQIPEITHFRPSTRIRCLPKPRRISSLVSGHSRAASTCLPPPFAYVYKPRSAQKVAVVQGVVSLAGITSKRTLRYPPSCKCTDSPRSSNCCRKSGFRYAPRSKSSKASTM